MPHQFPEAQEVVAAAPVAVVVQSDGYQMGSVFVLTNTVTWNALYPSPVDQVSGHQCWSKVWRTERDKALSAVVL